MSGRLVSKVFESALPAWLKPYAAACASFASDDGQRVCDVAGAKYLIAPTEQLFNGGDDRFMVIDDEQGLRSPCNA